MSSHIPPELNAEINEDPFYKQCCITGRTYEKVERHHHLIYASKQVNEKFCILPLAQSIHAKVSNPHVKARCDWIMTNRATEAELRRYSKAIDYVELRDRLNALLGGPWAPGLLPPPIPASVLS